MRAPELMAIAAGITAHGAQRCYYCGSRCNGLRPAAVKPTFTGWSNVVCPGSDFRCAGCDLAMDEKRVMAGKDKPQKTRNYSWVITESECTHYTKSDIAILRVHCLYPPRPPYAICIATSGQKQILYQTPVCIDSEQAVIGMEGEVITYITDELASLVETVDALAAVIGKPTLTGDIETGHVIRVHEAMGDEGIELLQAWERIRSQPLSRLAAFLAKPKGAATND